MIRRAKPEDLEGLALLFDGYRQFYEQPADLELARGYIQDRMANGESIIFVCEDENGGLSGFTQLYPTFCSVEAQPILVLYDLFVSADCRRGGVGRALMLAAQDYGTESGVARLDLQTAVDNHPGQAPYEPLGSERDEHFYSYSFEPGSSTGGLWGHEQEDTAQTHLTRFPREKSVTTRSATGCSPSSGPPTPTAS
jgi:ribosomal protein S18 acetylase RimI-like enzyme